MTSTSLDRLVVVVDTDRPTEMGYGLWWRATIRAVVEGVLPDADVRLAVHASSKRYAGHFQCCDPEQGVEVTLRRIEQRPAALSGFVAADGTIWEIVDVKP